MRGSKNPSMIHSNMLILGVVPVLRNKKVGNVKWQSQEIFISSKILNI